MDVTSPSRDCGEVTASCIRSAMKEIVVVIKTTRRGSHERYRRQFGEVLVER